MFCWTALDAPGWMCQQCEDLAWLEAKIELRKEKRLPAAVDDIDDEK